MNMQVQLVECPRDAMQGIHRFIPTEAKAAYLNSLLKVGFHTLDFGSFVSEKAVPQMRDTAQVLELLDLSEGHTPLLAIVANTRGAVEAAGHSAISYLGYPFSISETFQLRNTQCTMEQSLVRVEEINSICRKAGKKLVLYLSMGFGNPYGDAWSPELAVQWTTRLHELFEIDVISLSDTVGVATPEIITNLFKELIPALPHTVVGAHLHTTPDTWRPKVQAAYEAGCRRFDGAMRGFGGCPMATDKLTGNMPTENLVQFFIECNAPLDLDKAQFDHCLSQAGELFGRFS